ncbi:TetR/AcrR family transcriptional regulator [Jannaschia aquimarina]|uniref:AcnR protein n=1 Tax=Jannaschia aquimarina TaxID=935700 RepID=A0A0D1ELN5_9RHOB|nr:TetR/AcrR family transcriptional regulator [Jannaschia aquimarina]KIT16675.1 HTH-type transcriptional repressor AcnR [Jannaschia aquimarina]SNS55465.1 transcriptional regulator, TetR family [Jannaschia aquimarina]
MNEATPIDTGVVKRGRKFDQVLEGARAVFLADGFEGASVDAIARAAGVSKATLYSYFPDKQHLFMEVAKSECGAQIDQAGELLFMECAPRVALGRAARQIVGFVISEFGQSIFRMCVAESERFPELGREFFRTGPARFRAQMAEYLTRAVERGELKIDDIDLAGDQFVELCHATLFVEMVFNVRTSATQAEIDRVIDGAVETFMARYGP